MNMSPTKVYWSSLQQRARGRGGRESAGAAAEKGPRSPSAARGRGRGTPAHTLAPPPDPSGAEPAALSSSPFLPRPWCLSEPGGSCAQCGSLSTSLPRPDTQTRLGHGGCPTKVYIRVDVGDPEVLNQTTAQSGDRSSGEGCGANMFLDGLGAARLWGFPGCRPRPRGRKQLFLCAPARGSRPALTSAHPPHHAGLSSPKRGSPGLRALLPLALRLAAQTPRPGSGPLWGAYGLINPFSPRFQL